MDMRELERIENAARRLRRQYVHDRIVRAAIDLDVVIRRIAAWALSTARDKNERRPA